jgi:DNA-nicking Smr family endonuclease
MSQRRLSLAEIKQKIKNPAKPVKPASPANIDEKELFRQAMAGARQLAPDDHAQTGRLPPPPIPRPRAKDAEPEPVRPQRANDWVPATWLSHEAPPAQAENLHPDLASALRGVTPIETDRVSLDLPKPRPQPIQRDRDEHAALLESIYAPTSLELHLEGGEELTHLVNGVPQGTLRDLRRGRWVIQDQVDLHGCNRDEARDLLAACMAQWKKRGIRCVRVIHGKGRGSPGREPVLKKLVAGWLRNYEDVMAYCQARLPDGGAGALIVLLRASRTTSLL